jgi:hypothetical protein
VTDKRTGDDGTLAAALAQDWGEHLGKEVAAFSRSDFAILSEVVDRERDRRQQQIGSEQRDFERRVKGMSDRERADLIHDFDQERQRNGAGQ